MKGSALVKEQTLQGWLITGMKLNLGRLVVVVMARLRNGSIPKFQPTPIPILEFPCQPIPILEFPNYF